jgi:hypothetical protein
MEDIILYKKQTHAINLNNSGTMNQQNLDFAKRTMLFDVIREYTDLVKTKQGYPNNDISDVEMEIDCVVISRKRYKMLSEMERITTNNLVKSAKEYLKFPKLEP